MTEEEVRRKRALRKKEKRLKHRRVIYARRTVAAIVAVLLVALLVKGVIAVGGMIFGNENTSDTVARTQQDNTEDVYEDEYLERAASIDVKSIDVAEDDETGKGLLEKVEEYPQYKIILADREEYPDEIADLALRNPEAMEFVLDYPEASKVEHDIEVEAPTPDKIPLYIQWDEQWGYESYGNNIIAISGCGPTSLSMVATYLLQDSTYNPYYVANFSQEHGYCTSVGTDWLLMTEGAAMLGLSSHMVNLDEAEVAKELQAGNPVICSMGPGDFTDVGHFLVLTGYEDGYVTINDPNSPVNSDKKWLFADIIDQIKNIWAFSL